MLAIHDTLMASEIVTYYPLRVGLMFRTPLPPVPLFSSVGGSEIPLESEVATETSAFPPPFNGQRKTNMVSVKNMYNEKSALAAGHTHMRHMGRIVFNNF